MLRFDRFFINPFDDDSISLAELSAYTTDHLGRMVANNPGALLNGRINATTVAFTTLESCATDDGVKLGLRKARVMIKDQFRTSLSVQLGYIEGAIKSFFKAQSPEVLLECFPEGLTAIAKSRDDGVNNHLMRLVTALTARTVPTGSMPATTLNDASGLLSTWTAIYAASESSSANKTATENEKRAARKNLQFELFTNLLFLAGQFPGETDKATLFMRQSLLENPTRSEEEPEPPAPPAPTPTP